MKIISVLLNLLFIFRLLLFTATANGLRFGWLTFDEFYSRSGPFLRTLDQRGQNYVAEVTVDTMLWTISPDILYKAHCREHGPGEPMRTDCRDSRITW